MDYPDQSDLDDCRRRCFVVCMLGIPCSESMLCMLAA